MLQNLPRMTLPPSELELADAPECPCAQAPRHEAGVPRNGNRSVDVVRDRGTGVLSRRSGNVGVPREYDRLRTRADAKLAENGGHLVADGLLALGESIRNCPVIQAAGDQD